MDAMALKALFVLKRNIDAILKARGLTQGDLARACGRSEAWLSNIFTKANRELPLKYLDRIADYFGLAAYQLFTPGISHLTERRKNRDRRSGVDRRTSHVAELRLPVPSRAELDERTRQMTPEQFRRWMVHASAAATLATREQADIGPLGPREIVPPPAAPTGRTRRKRKTKGAKQGTPTPGDEP